MKFNFKAIIMLVLIVAVMIAAVSIFSAQTPNDEKFTYSDLMDLFENDLVKSFNVDGNSVITVKALKPAFDNSINETCILLQ